MATSPDPYSYRPIATHVGVELDTDQDAKLQHYEAFLGSEALAAGGIGPSETDRIRDRHVADALLFLAGLPPDAARIADIGSGVGLPGVPIAICRPDLEVVLVDRSQRRTDLAGRAVRILGLSNVAVVQADVAQLPQNYDVLTFRASLTIEAAARVVQGRRSAPVTGLFGVSRGENEPELPRPPAGIRYELTEESKGMLDSPFWLLRMTNE